jgi:hypothetical protein
VAIRKTAKPRLDDRRWIGSTTEDSAVIVKNTSGGYYRELAAIKREA